jgi:hypothetical protein
MFNFVYRQQSGFNPLHMPEFLLGQMLALSPGIFVLCVLAIWQIPRAWIRSKDRATLFLGVTTVIPVAYFLYESFTQQIGLHWPTAAWIGALVQIACAWSLAISHGERRFIRWCHISLALALAITAVMYPLVHIPQSWMSFRWAYKHQPERISTDKLAERFGWRDLGQWVSDVRREMLDAQKNRLAGSGMGGVFVLTGQYGLSSNVAFYTPEQIRTHLWRSKKTCGENYRFWDDFRSFKGMDSIYVAKEQRRAEQAMASLRQHFRKVQEPERLPIIVDGQEVRAFFLVRSYEYNGEIPEFD